MDFDHEGPQDLPLFGGLCLVKRTLGREQAQQQQNEPNEASTANKQTVQAKVKRQERFTWRWWKILRWTLGRCCDGLCVLWESSSGSMEEL